jgi:hypothetical protein
LSDDKPDRKKRQFRTEAPWKKKTAPPTASAPSQPLETIVTQTSVPSGPQEPYAPPVDLSEYKLARTEKAEQAAAAGRPTMEYIFPYIGERLPASNLEKGNLYTIGKFIGGHIGFDHAFDDPEEIMRDVLMKYRPIKMDAPVTREQIPQEDVDWLLTETARVLLSKEFEFYQDAMRRVVNFDALITHYISPMQLGIVGWSLRNQATGGAPNMKGLQPFDFVQRVEDGLFALQLGDVVYQMVEGHKMFGEDMKETAGDIFKNKNARKHLQMMATSFALPVISDAMESKDPPEFLYQHYVQPIEKIFRYEQGKKGVANAIIGGLKGALHETAHDTYQRTSKIPELLKENDNLIVRTMATAFDSTLDDMVKFTTIMFRSVEMFLLAVPYATQHLSMAVVEDVAGMIAQRHYAGKPPLKTTPGPYWKAA